MHSRTLAGALAVVLLAAGAPLGAAPGDATLFRIFLKDGSTLVSYGEIARVGARVVFSMPSASASDAALHLVDLAADRVDWERTDRYADAARAAHYVETQGELDYAAMSNRIAETLNQLNATTDAPKRLAIVESARKTLADWPANHFNYRSAEIRQLLSMLDEAIADLRAANGSGRFDLNLLAITDPNIPAEPLLPPPTPKEAIEQVLMAARVVDTPSERKVLLNAALADIDQNAGSLPSAWMVSARAEAHAVIERDEAIDRSYALLTQGIMTVAGRQARLADVTGLERLLTRIDVRDRELGAQRPDAVKALTVAVQAQLDAARRLRLARDRWALRAPAFRRYRIAIALPMERFAGLTPSLEAIKALSGSTPSSLSRIERVVAGILDQVSGVAPPDEFRPAHALLVSAVQLAASAASIRRSATIAGDMAQAWDASSAAAGALMLGTRARTEMQTLLRPPELR